MKIIQYKLIVASSLQELETNVNSYVKQKVWEPFGTPGTTKVNGVDVVFQAVIRWQDPTNPEDA